MQTVVASSLVPGDVLKVTGGEKVPADVRIIEAHDLKVNNASLTGENADIKLGPLANHADLYEAKNVARSGCNFTQGSNLFLFRKWTGCCIFHWRCDILRINRKINNHNKTSSHSYQSRNQPSD